jgi:hypothetical protein
VNVFRRCGTHDKDTLDAIGITLIEILGNCFFHSSSGSGIYGLACAQSWPAASLAQVAVVDGGIGIRTSLGNNPALAGRLAAENALDLATEYGVTGKPEGKHSGYGLTLARQLMEKHDGHFLLISGREAVHTDGRTVKREDLQSPWQGTIVILEWPIDRALDIGTVYKSWPASDDKDELF